MHTAEEVRAKTNHLRGLFGQHELREMLLAYADLLEVLHELGTYGIHKETVYRTLDRAAEGAEQGMSDEQYAADCEGYGGSGRNKVPRGLVFVPFFDENKLGSEIARVWGANGAHAEVYGMMRKELSAAKAEAERLREALEKVERWQFPPTGKFWESGTPVSYGAAYGSNGERDYMRNVARAALAATRKEDSSG